jgi:hypothetical protein
MDDRHLMVNDPGMSQGGTLITLDDFFLAWDEMANLYGIIRTI